MKRILLLLSQKENQQLLADELEGKYEVLVGRSPGDLEQLFDLCVMDGRSLDEHWEQVQARKARDQPIFLPILLVTSRPGVKMITRHVWRSVDELIISPIEKAELRARMEILLRVRALTLGLQKRAEEADRARSAAIDASQAKSEFLANMSHELRTPINAITGYTELLELGIAGPLTEQQVAHLGRIRFSTDHLLTLVNEVLNLAKVESGRMQVEAERVSIVETVREAMDLITPQATTHRVELRNLVEGQGSYAYWGDPDRVRQILVNLFSNAVRFTPQGGEVSVAASEVRTPEGESSVTGDGPWIAVEVRDTGIGIPPEKVQSVFEPFVQVDASHTRAREGTGLGLTISRRLARLMNGDLTVDSTMGSGSTFTLWLPAASTAIAPGASGRAAGRQIDVPRLSEVGHTLARCADDIVSEVGARMRSDPGTPGAAHLDRAQLENHTATFLVDIGRALVTLDEGGGDPALMRDATEIQRTIAQLHGAQRARLAWPDEAVRREYEILSEVIALRLREALNERPGEAVDEALDIVARLLDQAERVTLRGWSRAEQEKA